MLGIDIFRIVINIPIVLIALTVHEFAHGWVSSKLGDPTPERDGRLTLNPFAHLDLAGTILMILTGFGWAKPVMVDPRYYKNQKKGMAITAAAGPLSNLLMAIIGMIVYYSVVIIKEKFQINMDFSTLLMFVYVFIYTNLCFMVFNIIPIPPLDGSKVLGLLLPNRVYYTMLQYERYSMILIMVLSLTGVFGGIIGSGVNLIISLIDKPLLFLAGLIL